MGNTEMRGKIDDIVLTLLSESDMHAGQLKQIIDEKYSEIKQCTLYAALKRLLDLQLIQEYRASSSDGLRRKFYRLTSKNARECIKFKPITDYKPKSTPYIQEIKPKVEVKTEAVAVEAPSKSVTDNVVVDYDKPIEDVYLVKNKSSKPFDITSSPRVIIDSDEDSVAFSTFDYKSSLEKLFPKDVAKSTVEPAQSTPTLQEEIEDEISDIDVGDVDGGLNDEFEQSLNLNDEEEINDAEEEVENTENEEISVIEEDKEEDKFDDVYELANIKGLKIKTSNDTNRYRGNKLLVNKLRLATSFTFYALILLELLLSYLFLDHYVGYGLKIYGLVAAICFAVPLFAILLFSIDKNKSVKEIAKFQNVFTISCAITINIIICITAYAFFKNFDLYNFNTVLKTIILPSVLTLNIPIYYAIKYSLAKSDSYYVL